MKNQYSYRELCEKYQWGNPVVRQDKMVEVAAARGVIIVPAETNLKKKMLFNIIDDSIANYNWITCAKIPEYEVCREGLIRNSKNKRIWNSTYNGYVYVKDKVTRQNFSAHRLIMETFNPIDNMEDYIVDHINGMKADNRLENLRWVSAKGNQMYKIENWNLIQEPFMELLDLVGYEGMIQILKEQIEKNKKNQ